MLKHALALSLLLISVSGFASSYASAQGRKAIYWVPVPQELAEYAVFTIDKIAVEKSSDHIRLTYRLPLELTGAANIVSFEGAVAKSGPLELKGNNGRAECPSADELSRCKIYYENLEIDPEARRALLQAISATPDEASQREMVALRFCPLSGGEPCGFLTLVRE